MNICLEILHGNYKKVFIDARPKVREFEDKVLTDEFIDKNVISTEGPRTVAAWLRPEVEKILDKKATEPQG
jgi:hypothetical protein